MKPQQMQTKIINIAITQHAENFNKSLWVLFIFR